MGRKKTAEMLEPMTDDVWGGKHTSGKVNSHRTITVLAYNPEAKDLRVRYDGKTRRAEGRMTLHSLNANWQLMTRTSPTDTQGTSTAVQVPDAMEADTAARDLKTDEGDNDTPRVAASCAPPPSEMPHPFAADLPAHFRVLTAGQFLDMSREVSYQPPTSQAQAQPDVVTYVKVADCAALGTRLLNWAGEGSAKPWHLTEVYGALAIHSAPEHNGCVLKTVRVAEMYDRNNSVQAAKDGSLTINAVNSLEEAGNVILALCEEVDRLCALVRAQPKTDKRPDLTEVSPY